MCEYQCHEFAAIDRPLASIEMAGLSAVSSRAEITPPGFRHHDAWSDPLADWCRSGLMLHLPRGGGAAGPKAKADCGRHDAARQ